MPNHPAPFRHAAPLPCGAHARPVWAGPLYDADRAGMLAAADSLAAETAPAGLSDADTKDAVRVAAEATAVAYRARYAELVQLGYPADVVARGAQELAVAEAILAAAAVDYRVRMAHGCAVCGVAPLRIGSGHRCAR